MTDSQNEPIEECAKRIGRKRAVERYEPPDSTDVAKEYARRVLPPLARYLPIPITVFVSAGVMSLLGGEMTINGEAVQLAPTPEIVGALLVFVTVVWAGIEFGPGMVGGRR